MGFRVFIGWDSRFPEPGLVLAHSIRQRAFIPLDIRFLDLRHLKDCYGFKAPHDSRATTEFTYSRFLVPWLCGYEGVAMFLDNDMLCLGDIAELANLPMEGLALRVRKHEQKAVDGALKMGGAVQTAYPRKNHSSFMVMDCARLKCWTKEVVEEGDGARLHRFRDVADEQIGEVPDGWNDLEPQYRPGITRTLHWTEGMVWNYPDWKERRARGELPDFPWRQLWLDAYDAWRENVEKGHEILEAATVQAPSSGHGPGSHLPQ